MPWLGLPKNGDGKRDRSAFRKLARQHIIRRESRYDEAEARFKQINEANEVLSDHDKRAVYDALDPLEGVRAVSRGRRTASPAEFAQATGRASSGGAWFRAVRAGPGRGRARPPQRICAISRPGASVLRLLRVGLWPVARFQSTGTGRMLK